MSPQAGWLLQQEIIPRLKSAIPVAVICVGCEDAAELVQDATAFAAKLLRSVEKAGKKVTPGNIAYYTIQHIKSGRRSTGASVADVYGSATQLRGRTRLMSLEEQADGEEQEVFTFNDVLSTDQEDPSTRAARKLDWETLCAGLPEQERAVVEFIAQGKTFRQVAQAFGVCDSAIHKSKEALGSKILEFMGPDILREVRRMPQWRNDLDANREKFACRQERRAASAQENKGTCPWGWVAFHQVAAVVLERFVSQADVVPLTNTLGGIERV